MAYLTLNEINSNIKYAPELGEERTNFVKRVVKEKLESCIDTVIKMNTYKRLPQEKRKFMEKFTDIFYNIYDEIADDYEQIRILTIHHEFGEKAEQKYDEGYPIYYPTSKSYREFWKTYEKENKKDYFQNFIYEDGTLEENNYDVKKLLKFCKKYSI